MLYRLLLFAHVFAVILWVGAGATFQLRSERISRTWDPHAIRAMVDDGNFLGKFYFGPLTLIVLATGLGMVFEGGWGFGHVFVVGGLVGLVASGAIGFAVIEPTAQRLGVRLASPTAAVDDGVRADVLRLRNIGRVDTALMAAIVFLMTVKPGG